MIVQKSGSIFYTYIIFQNQLVEIETTKFQSSTLIFLFSLRRTYHLHIFLSLFLLCIFTLTTFAIFNCIYILTNLLQFSANLLQVKNKGIFIKYSSSSRKAVFLYCHLTLPLSSCHARVHNVQCLWKLHDQ